MDKEIIIDGVDVAGCTNCFEQSGEMLCMMIDQYFCEGNNCYYKQLKRLEQENAELKAENERLKAEIKNNKSAYQVELGTYNMECGNLLKENEQYHQTLQEIKAICKMDCGDCQHNQDCDCNFEECEEAKIDDILDLITKAGEE